ncbi:Zn2Cys6 transcription factor [Pyrenophora seminiperda CCB06]|uniref:Zn2Cys6 transcription factor n=1 Tax=Pyrenophora seminiperda CCB06 TaxID=1302712 RepID=A0A3M7M655_9PLEO|nr:Zn2Cys6 transcription factor [Pyrenophora seminiperda CCB06]
MEEKVSRKRPRPVVSCLRCREKKLKCDRTTPCDNCVKASSATTCVYNRISTMPPNPGPGLSQSGSLVESSQFNPIGDLQQRLAKVEELLGMSQGQRNLETAHVEVPIIPPSLRGAETAKVYRPHSYGENATVTLLNEFIDVRDFLNGMGDDRQLMAAVKQIKFLQTKYAARLTPSRSMSNVNFSQAWRNLWEYLPPKSYCDRLVTTYFRCFERCLRIVHRPTFMRQYEGLWLSDNWEMCSRSIIPQLTAILTVAYHIDDATPDDGAEDHSKYLRGAAVELVQAWLDGLDRRQRTELSTLQVELLLLCARSFREPHVGKTWSYAGSIVRSALLMGLHLDPTGMKDISPYQAEIRRRLWASVVELDLQTSMKVHLPLIVPEMNSYQPVPSNLNDDDFDEHSETLPMPRPLSELTDSLFQICLATSFPSRLKAISLVQWSSPNPIEIMEIGWKIKDCLSSKPLVLCLQNCQVAPNDDSPFSNRVQLDIYIQRTLQYLYRPLLLTAQPYTTALTEIRRHCLQSSLAILSYKEFHTPEKLSLVVGNPLMKQDFFVRMWKPDMLWAGLTACQHIRLVRMSVAAGSLQQSGEHDKAILVKTVESTIDFLIDRIGREGSDLKDILFLSLALKWVQLPNSRPDKLHALHEHTKQLLEACLEKLLQPLKSQSGYRRDLLAHYPYQATPPAAKRPRTLPPSAYWDSNAVTSLGTMDASTHSPLNFYSFPDHANSAASWLMSSPSQAAEYANYRIDMYDDAHDSFGFNTTPDWNWGNTWR